MQGLGEVWRITVNKAGERGDKCVCLFRRVMLHLLHHPVFLRQENLLRNVSERSKKRFLSGEELNLAGESLSFSTAPQSMLAGSSIQKTNP